MIIGAHSIIYSKNPEADRSFLRDVLGMPHVDVGEGWLIFGLPPAEVAVHPGDENDVHEFYLMSDDIKVTLPGGGKLGVYQPRHERPKAMVGKKKAVAPKKASRRKK